MEISSNQFNPRVIEQTTSSITIAWDQVSPDAEVYKVERHHKTGEWTRVYWGSESPAKVDNLEENFGYKFRIVAMKFLEEKGYEPISISMDFVGATISSPPSALILYRSIKKSEQFLVKRLILKRRILMDLPSANGNTPLANAISLGEKDIFDVLMSANVSIHHGNFINNRTPLHFSFFHGQLAMSRMLLNKKANLNAPDCVGMTPSHYAVDAEQIEILKFAIENKCNKEAKDNCGWTLLLRAIAMKTNLNIIKLLVHHGCKLNAVDKSGLNCFQLANINGNQDVINYIENYWRNAGDETVKQTVEKTIGMMRAEAIENWKTLETVVAVEKTQAEKVIESFKELSKNIEENIEKSIQGDIDNSVEQKS